MDGAPQTIGNFLFEPSTPAMSALHWLPRLNRDPIENPKSLIILNF
jgi:hypothetical protein